jgi:nucleoside-diphosphate-sugar epimerase
LREKQCKITTFGRSTGNQLSIDFSKEIPVFSQPYDYVIHAAGLAHVMNASRSNDYLFNLVNFQGTKNIGRAFENLGIFPKQLVFISSVAVYGFEEGWDIDESFPLNGYSPYAISKIKAEEFLLEWGEKWGVKILILRLPLIAGINPPGNLGKMIKAIHTGSYFSLGRGRAKKSIVLADDIAKLLKDLPVISGIFNLTDGVHPSFRQLEEVICCQIEKRRPFDFPEVPARLLAKLGDLIPVFPLNSDTLNKMTRHLTFSDLKAREQLQWNPNSVLNKWKIYNNIL